MALEHREGKIKWFGRDARNGVGRARFRAKASQEPTGPDSLALFTRPPPQALALLHNWGLSPVASLNCSFSYNPDGLALVKSGDVSGKGYLLVI